MFTATHKKLCTKLCCLNAIHHQRIVVRFVWTNMKWTTCGENFSLFWWKNKQPKIKSKWRTLIYSHASLADDFFWRIKVVTYFLIYFNSNDLKINNKVIELISWLTLVTMVRPFFFLLEDIAISSLTRIPRTLSNDASVCMCPANLNMASWWWCPKVHCALKRVLLLVFLKIPQNPVWKRNN